MYWRPDRMICEYEVAGVQIREEKFIAANDAACSIITSSKPVTLRFNGQSFFGRRSISSSATVEYDAKHNAIHIVEGGTTKSKPETDRSERVGPIMYQGMSTVLTASRSFADSHTFKDGLDGERKYELSVPCDSDGVAVVWSMHDEYDRALENAMELLGRRPDQAKHSSGSPDNNVNQPLPERRSAWSGLRPRQHTGEVLWQHASLPNWRREFDSPYLYLIKTHCFMM